MTFKILVLLILDFNKPDVLPRHQQNIPQSRIENQLTKRSLNLSETKNFKPEQYSFDDVSSDETHQFSR